MFFDRVLKTAGKTCIYASQWCTLQAFVQATMWHNTDPDTFGLSLWALSVFLAALCIPGLLYVIIVPILPLKYISPQNQNFTTRFQQFLSRIISALTLAISSLPVLEDKAEMRTIILAIGVIAISYYVIMVGWRRQKRNLRQNYESRGQRKINNRLCNHKHRTLCTNGYFFRHGCLVNVCESSCVGNELLIALLAVMTIRWYFNSVNIFYDEWKASVSLLILVTVHSSAVLVAEGGICHNTRAFRLYSSHAEEEPKSDIKHCVSEEVVADNRSDMLTVESRAMAAVDNNTGAHLKTASQAKYDDGNETHYLESPSQLSKEMTRDSENHNLQCSSFEDDNMDSTLNKGRAYNEDICCPNKKSNTAILFVLALLLGPASGSLAALSISIFTSPAVLCRWGDIPAQPLDNLLVTCFAFGCLCGFLLNTERFGCYTKSKLKDIERLHEPQIKREMFPQFVINTAICCVMLCGVCLILYTKKSCFFIGACILCMVVPVIIKTTVSTVDMTIMACQASGRKRLVRVVPGLVMLLCGVAFAVFHTLNIMFINPQLTVLFLGRMDIILWSKTIVALMPLVLTPALRAKFDDEERPRSSSTGPLIPPRSRNQTGDDHQRVVGRSIAFSSIRERRKCEIRSQAFITVLIVVSTMIAKYFSHNHNVPCNFASVSGCHGNSTDDSFKIRVLSWNLLLGHKMNGRSNLASVAEVINSYKSHVSALQEADALPAYWGGRDIFHYLQNSATSCQGVARGINPMRSTLGVGILSRLKIVEEWSDFLPTEGGKKLPHYSVTRITCEVRGRCENESNVSGSGDDVSPSNATQRLYVYSLHAVYKNWTCARLSRISCQQMKFVHDDIANLPRDSPVIVMGDFNINPSERELDIWFQSDLGFKSALWPERNYLMGNRTTGDESCTGESPVIDEGCDCECLDKSSDPIKTTLLNRNASVDHIFYRGLSLSHARILDEVGRVSDHLPVFAEFTI